MPAIHLLGTGSAVADAHRTTTMLALESDAGLLAIDCGGDLYQRLLLAGLDALELDGLILTHEHPDHVGGFPLLMERLWLDGRTRGLPVYGIRQALDQAERLLGTYDTSNWSLPEIRWRPVDLQPGATVLSSGDWRITASPGVHGVPVTGLRCTHVPTGFAMGYSADTEPCDDILELVRGCDLLVHEATGAVRGHTSIQQAVGIAAEAGCPQLVLVHLTRGAHPDDLRPYADSGVEVILGEELDRFEF